jgi:hypothetical protein
MHPIVQVKVNFNSEKFKQINFQRNLAANNTVNVGHIDSLCEDLKRIILYYKNQPVILKNYLIDAEYNDVIAKSNRISRVLKPMRKTSNDVVVGARFTDAKEGDECHIITYYIDENTILNTIKEMQIAKAFLIDFCGGEARPDNFNITKDNPAPFSIEQYEKYLNKSAIRSLVVDCSVLSNFSVPHIEKEKSSDSFLVTFYQTELPVQSILDKIGIDSYKYRYVYYGNDTISVTKDLFDELYNKIPYMISMVSSDYSKVSFNETNDENEHALEIEIPEPDNEPIIGVIDTLFDTKVYFKKWVENHDYLDETEKSILKNETKIHGTEVSSIIVDGPRMNPWLDDGCGRFRVRHFGVCEDRISTARLVRKIKSIISENQDIHVWNLSLGTDEEISKNYISYDAAALDEIQAEYNVVFVISGTNDNRSEQTNKLRIGSPADSLNSIVVNSVRRDGRMASYSRRGKVLSFFHKPDFSYYGGDYDQRLKAYMPNREDEVYGTSFAAPWISRKLCYLIDIMGFPREVAKAILVDSAAGWEYKKETYRYQDDIGYGIVPINIEQVLNSNNDEIRFIVYGTSEAYREGFYGLPVPRDINDKYPFIARATMCYFPPCSRLQGVDYTNRELSLSFGRINNKGVIDDINDNIQDKDGCYSNERKSRKEFRKWENTKFISKLEKRNKPIISYGDRQWGIAIASKERLVSHQHNHMNFGVVITLKEISGNDRFEDFVKACRLRGLIVNEVNIENRIELYKLSQSTIKFE